MNFIGRLECAAFPGITNRLERDIAWRIEASGTMPTKDGWNIIRGLQTELSNIRGLIIEHNSLTGTITKNERDISHTAFLYPSDTVSSDNLTQSKERLKKVSTKLSGIYRREMNFTRVDLDRELTKINTDIGTLEQSYYKNHSQRSQDTIDLINELKQRRENMLYELQFIDQKLRKD